MKSYRSRAYGLDIESDIELPEFMPPGPGLDIRVQLDECRTEVDAGTQRWNFQAGEVRCFFPGAGKFVVKEGREIRITPVENADPGLLRLYVEGMMMAILLHQRNHYVLHASVVQVEGVGVAFVGSIGAGKSSMAMALHARGHAVIADDNAAINILSGTQTVTPAFPRVKIFPAIALALGMETSSLQFLHSSQVKKTRSVASTFPTCPIRLDHIYALDKNCSSAISKLPLPAAVLELIKHSIPTRWGLPGDREQLYRSAELARRVPIYRLRTFNSLESLPALADVVEKHCRETTLQLPCSLQAAQSLDSAYTPAE